MQLLNATLGEHADVHVYYKNEKYIIYPHVIHLPRSQTLVFSSTNGVELVDPSEVAYVVIESQRYEIKKAEQVSTEAWQLRLEEQKAS